MIVGVGTLTFAPLDGPAVQAAMTALPPVAASGRVRVLDEQPDGEAVAVVEGDVRADLVGEP